jgi:hypothetical protein
VLSESDWNRSINRYVATHKPESLTSRLDEYLTHHFQLRHSKVFKYYTFYNGGTRQNFQKFISSGLIKLLQVFLTDIQKSTILAHSNRHYCTSVTLHVNRHYCTSWLIQTDIRTYSSQIQITLEIQFNVWSSTNQKSSSKNTLTVPLSMCIVTNEL